MSENLNNVSAGEARLFANTVKQGLTKPSRLARPFARQLYKWLRDQQGAEPCMDGLVKGRITYCFTKVTPNQVQYSTRELTEEELEDIEDLKVIAEMEANGELDDDKLIKPGDPRHAEIMALLKGGTGE